MTNEKIIEKIQKLLNTANDRGATENEAMIAAMKAQELMAKYDIQMTDIKSFDNSDEEIVEDAIDTGSGNKWKRFLATIVARNFCVKNFWCGNDVVVFYGYKKNTDVAREVFKFLFNAGNRFANRYYMQKYNAGYNTKGLKNTYLMGFLKGISSVLDEQCTALMLVVPKQVEEKYSERSASFKKTTRNIKFNDNDKAYGAGYSQGRATVNSRNIECRK